MNRILVVVLTLLSCRAMAGIYVEPYVSYEESTLKQDGGITQPVVQSYSAQSNMNGVAYGGKLGIAFSRVAIGADYLAQSLSIGGDSASISNYGVFAHVNLTDSFKIIGTYLLSSTLQGTESNGSTTTFKGKGFEVGLSYMILSHLAINLEYLNVKYDSTVPDPEPPVVYSDLNVSYSGAMLGISFPFDLL